MYLSIKSKVGPGKTSGWYRAFCLACFSAARRFTCHSCRWQPDRTLGSRWCIAGYYLRCPLGCRRSDIRIEYALFGRCFRTKYSFGYLCRFRTLFPALFAGKDLLHGDGLMLLIGVCITLAGIAIIGYAGSLRSRNMSEEEKRLP